jgi:hypothetical protein
MDAMPSILGFIAFFAVGGGAISWWLNRSQQEFYAHTERLAAARRSAAPPQDVSPDAAADAAKTMARAATK